MLPACWISTSTWALSRQPREQVMSFPADRKSALSATFAKQTADAPLWAEELPRVLSLWAAQIEAAIGETSKEMEAISDSYFTVATEAVDALKNGSPEAQQRAHVIEQEIHTALVKFQISDRVIQRLMNVRSGLTKLGDLFESEAATNSAAAWTKTLNAIRNSYTMAAERRMFDAALKHTDGEDISTPDIEETGHRLILFDED